MTPQELRAGAEEEAAELISRGLAPSTVKGFVLTTRQVFAQAVVEASSPVHH